MALNKLIKERQRRGETLEKMLGSFKWPVPDFDSTQFFLPELEALLMDRQIRISELWLVFGLLRLCFKVLQCLHCKLYASPKCAIQIRSHRLTDAVGPSAGLSPARWVYQPKALNWIPRAFRPRRCAEDPLEETARHKSLKNFWWWKAASLRLRFLQTQKIEPHRSFLRNTNHLLIFESIRNFKIIWIWKYCRTWSQSEDAACRHTV